ncbi:hypothetical protein ABZ608_03295 [Streptomyces sp. NPDC013172]|uniref:hypothetical protein n=1 Tax=Streptomyces sp. NPDC013172 TaxID=3155009 RepID=UPI0034047258
MSATTGSRTGRFRDRVLAADDQPGPGGIQARVSPGPRDETPRPPASIPTARSTSSDSGGGVVEARIPVPRRRTGRGRIPRRRTAHRSGQVNRPVEDGS